MRVSPRRIEDARAATAAGLTDRGATGQVLLDARLKEWRQCGPHAQNICVAQASAPGRTTAGLVALGAILTLICLMLPGEAALSPRRPALLSKVLRSGNEAKRALAPEFASQLTEGCPQNRAPS